MAPDLAGSSDTGKSQTDNITRIATPTIVGNGAESGATITLLASNGTTVLGTTTADVNGSWSITSTELATGSQSLFVSQMDLAGNVSAISPALTVTVDQLTSAPTISSAPTSTNPTPSLTGNAEAGASVTILNSSGTQVGTAMADGAGVWSYQFATPLNEGSNGFSVIATDVAGNESASIATTIQVDSPGTRGSNSSDFMQGTSQNDVIYALGGDDIVFGNNGDDSIYGGAGRDSLNGGSGRDILIGGAGADLLAGGSGQDIFRYTDISDAPRATGNFAVLNRETILDFNSSNGNNHDLIDLSAIDANVNVAGDQAFTFVGSSAFSGVAGQLRYANGILQADVDGDRIADLEIFVVSAPPLDRTDFVL